MTNDESASYFIEKSDLFLPLVKIHFKVAGVPIHT